MRRASAAYIFFLILFAFFGNSFTIPLLPELFARCSNQDLSKASLYAGINTAIGSIASFIALPSIGILSDKYGRKPLLILSCISIAITCFGMIVTDLLRSPWPMWIFTFVAGLISGLFPTAYAYVVDVSTMDKRSANFGLIGAAMGIANVAGPGVSGVIAGELGIAAAMGIALIFVFGAMLFVIFIVPESKLTKSYEPITLRKLNPLRSFSMLLDRRLALLLSIILVLNTVAQDGLSDIFVLFFKYKFKWGITEIGINLSISGLLLALTQGLGIRKIVPKIGNRRAALYSEILAMLFTGPMGAVPNVYLMLPLMVFGMLSFTITPIIQALITEEYEVQSQGELLGVLAGLKTLSAFVGPFIFNNLFSYFISDKAPKLIPGIPFYVASSIYLIALVVMIYTFRQLPETQAVVNQENVQSEDYNLIDREMEEPKTAC